MMLSEFPFFNSQQLNLDWILEKLSVMENGFVPYVKLDAVSADTDAALLSAFNSNVDKMPLGFSVLHFGVPNEDELQVFAICYRTDTESGTANIYTTGTDITLSVLDMVDGIWVAGTAPEYGTTVVANPVLAGTEADLTGLQVGDTKYKVPAGGGVLVVNLTASETEYTCDKTAAEIMDGVNNGAVIFKDVGEDYTDISYVIGVSYSEADGYTFGVLANGNNTQFYYTAASGTDYPTHQF